MVRPQCQHPALIWRHAYDVFAAPGETSGYWELVNEGTGYFAGVQLATINRMGKRLWELRYYENFTERVSCHRTLKEAQAVGLVNVRFNQASKS